jgi:O-antigen/teichoic acid export membrane protein
MTWEWMALGTILALSSWTSYSQILFQSHQQFGRLAAWRVIYPVVFLTANVILLPRWKIAGFLTAMGFAYFVLAVYGLVLHRRTLGFWWSTKKFFACVRIGLPLRLAGFVWMLIMSVGLWMVSLRIGGDAAGTYGFATLIGTAYGLIPGIMAEMGLPRLAFQWSRSGFSLQALGASTYDAIVAFAGLNVAVAVFALASFDGLIQHWLPKYQDAEGVMLVLVVGAYINGAWDLGGNALILLGRQRSLLALNVAILVVVLPLAYCVVAISHSPMLTACATSLGLALNCTGVVAMMRAKLGAHLSGAQLLRFAGMVFSGVAVIVLTWWVASEFTGWTRTAVYVVLGLLLSAFHTGIGGRSIQRFWNETA